MKKIYLTLLVGYLIIFSGCEEDFLEKYPLTSVSPETFFKKDDDFKLYVNQFYNDLGDYSQFSPGTTDLNSDNQVQSTPSIELNGEIVKEVEDDNWNNAYSSIRNINIMLVSGAESELTNIGVYLGEARFFRAWHYYKLLQRFGGVPWIEKPPQPNDEEILSTPRSSRNEIAAKIVEDLDVAIANLPSITQAEKFRLNKETALAFKSRVCLFEGTWEKYHAKEATPFKVDGSDGKQFLQQAMDAANQVITNGILSISKGGDEPYFNLFNREDYTGNSEILLWRKIDRDLIGQTISREIQGANHTGGLTKNLIEDYLALDGMPMSLTSLPLADDSLLLLIQNRDPRLAQTLYYTGVAEIIDDASGEPLQIYSHAALTNVPTGYHYRKGGSPLNSNMAGNLQDQVAYIYFRYGEVLLNYIEAKAELNESGDETLTQSDFDVSINELRDRVGMPAFDFNTPIVDPDDPFTDDIPWYLVEIRRERRIELVVEEFRRMDVFRWAGADELIKGKIFLGAPYKWYQDRGWYSDEITGVNDDGILSPWHNTAIDLQGGYNFDLNRDYLFPIPSQEEVLAGYTNNPGWE